LINDKQFVYYRQEEKWIAVSRGQAKRRGNTFSIVLKFPKWLEPKLKSQPLDVRNHWCGEVLEKDLE